MKDKFLAAVRESIADYFAPLRFVYDRVRGIKKPFSEYETQEARNSLFGLDKR